MIRNDDLGPFSQNHYIPRVQTPEKQNDFSPEHDSLRPHLHLPSSQASDVCGEHGGLIPHVHLRKLQVSDNLVQSSFLMQS